MTFQLVGGDTGNLDAVVNQVNQNIAQLKVQDTTNIFKDDAGTRRVLLGKGKDGFYGLKVSQEGTDVYDGANADMVFNSDNNLFKIVSSDTVDVTVSNPMASGTKVTATIAHGLSSAPAYIAFVTIPAGAGVYATEGQLSQLPALLVNEDIADVGGAVVIYAQGRVDATNLYFDVINVSGSSIADLGTPWSFKYYILQETAV